MMMITICQVHRSLDEETRQKVGEIYLKPFSDLGADASAEETVRLSNETSIEVLANYDASSNSVTVHVKEGGSHIASLVARWDGGGLPYFAFYTKDGIFTELYFEK